MGASPKRRGSVAVRLLLLLAGGGFWLFQYTLIGPVVAVPCAGTLVAAAALFAAARPPRRPLIPAAALSFGHAAWSMLAVIHMKRTGLPVPPWALEECVASLVIPLLLVLRSPILPALLLVAWESLGVWGYARQLDGAGLEPDQRHFVLAHATYLGAALVALAGGLAAAYFRPGERSGEVFDLVPADGGGLSRWVRDADGNFRRG